MRTFLPSAADVDGRAEIEYFANTFAGMAFTPHVKQQKKKIARMCQSNAGIVGYRMIVVI